MGLRKITFFFLGSISLLKSAELGKYINMYVQVTFNYSDQSIKARISFPYFQ